MERKIKHTPPRLPEIFQRYDTPVYLITVCTLNRQPVLASPEVHTAFCDYAKHSSEFGVVVGRYVIMPNHLHVFVGLSGDVPVGRWVKGLKRSLDKPLQALGHKPTVLNTSKLTSFWQPGAFDHLLRNTESYGQKWQYVWQNPVRAGLITQPGNWPYQGEITHLDRV